MKRTMDAFDSYVQKTVEFPPVRHIEKIVSVPVMRHNTRQCRVCDTTLSANTQTAQKMVVVP